MPQREAKLNLYRKLGATLIIRGQWFLRNAFKIKDYQRDGNQIKLFINQTLGLSLNRIILTDRKYWLTDWETWLKLIEYDWTEKKKYLTDRYDCENFANSFSARMAEIYNLNSAGSFYNKIYNKKTGRFINWHRANMIVAIREGNLELYAFESMFGTPKDWIKIEKPSQKIIIRNWRYVPISFRMG